MIPPDELIVPVSVQRIVSLFWQREAATVTHLATTYF